MDKRRRLHGAVNAFMLFESNNTYGIPELPKPALTQPPTWLAPFRSRISKAARPTDGALHFFLEDFRFESVWNKPHTSLQALQNFSTVLTPDFSLYRDWPLAVQLWNTYRSRWVGRFWHAHGFTVIPTISWSSEASYSFSFCGVPCGSVVAISTCGVNHRQHPVEKALFMAGFRRMIQTIQPTAVLCYGTPPAECANEATIWVYPTQWTNIRAMRKRAAQRMTPDNPQHPLKGEAQREQEDRNSHTPPIPLLPIEGQADTDGW